MKVVTKFIALFFLSINFSLFTSNQLAISANSISKTTIGNFELFWSTQPEVLNTPISGDTDETYLPSDRKWNGLPTITRTKNGRLWAAWMTGGFLEPDTKNYNVMYYSDDNGKTWSEEFLIIESTTDRAVYDPRLFHDQDGILWLYLNYGGSKGIIITNPDCENPSQNLKFSSSAYTLAPSPFAHRPTILSSKWNNIWIAPVESSSALLTQQIYASVNKVVWEELSTVTTSSPANKRFNESQIIELNDGKLMMLSRLDGGSGLERCYSHDGGKTWTPMETNLPAPLIGPGSKFHLQRLASGSILLLNHNSTSGREKITAYLSTDDGATWPYSIVLDDRDNKGGYWGVSYPEAADSQGNSGEIYIVWDQRTPLVEINSAILTEEDIKAGKVVTDGSFTFKPVVRNSSYYDITGIKETIDYNLTVNLGTSKTSIIERLPSFLTITDELGKEEIYQGTWKTLDYNSNIVGTYTFTFDPTNAFPEYLIDSYNLIRVKVKVINNEETTGGCNNSAIYFGISTLALATSLLILFRKKKV